MHLEKSFGLREEETFQHPRRYKGIRGGARWGEPKLRKSVKGQSSRVSVCGCECVFAYADVWVG